MSPVSSRISFAIAARSLDLLRLGDALREIAAASAAEVRVDLADGTFVPGFGLGYPVLAAVRNATDLPVHVHLLAERPEHFFDVVRRIGCASLTVPIEACLHAHRTITQIRELGMAPGVSIRPGSPLTKLEYVLPMIDHLVLPVRDIGAEDRPVPAAAFDRVRILRENLDYHESKAVLHVEGNLDVSDAARLEALGATRVVIDREAVLRAGNAAESSLVFMDGVARAKRTV